jgi:hypothetical protein
MGSLVIVMQILYQMSALHVAPTDLVCGIYGQRVGERYQGIPWAQKTPRFLVSYRHHHRHSQAPESRDSVDLDIQDVRPGREALALRPPRSHGDAILVHDNT